MGAIAFSIEANIAVLATLAICGILAERRISRLKKRQDQTDTEIKDLHSRVTAEENIQKTLTLNGTLKKTGT